MDKAGFGCVFRVGEIINSGGPSDRSNAARIEILAIEDAGVRYRSLKAKDAKYLPYSTLSVILHGFHRVNPKAIQRTIQPVYLDAGLNRNVFTENYEYGFAKEYLARAERESHRE